MSEAATIPKTQTAALIRKQGDPVEFDDNYPVPVPKDNEILVKVLFTGVCQSGKFAVVVESQRAFDAQNSSPS
jgi:D-arabinose 1-dehydrogenase-like Zn-dependent alcohol dehydrogenase